MKGSHCQQLSEQKATWWTETSARSYSHKRFTYGVAVFCCCDEVSWSYTNSVHNPGCCYPGDTQKFKSFTIEHIQLNFDTVINFTFIYWHYLLSKNGRSWFWEHVSSPWDEEKFFSATNSNETPTLMYCLSVFCAWTINNVFTLMISCLSVRCALTGPVTCTHVILHLKRA